MKTSAERDITVSGPDLAAQAITAGLVDELQLFVAPIVVGGGKRSLPDNVRLELELLDERRFANGMVHLHYCPPDLKERSHEQDPILLRDVARRLHRGV